MKVAGGGGSFELTDEEMSEFNKRFNAWLNRKDSLIILDFCKEEGITRARLQQLCARDEKLQHTYQRAKEHTERMLIKGGLSNRFEITGFQFNQI